MSRRVLLRIAILTLPLVAALSAATASSDSVDPSPAEGETPPLGVEIGGRVTGLEGEPVAGATVRILRSSDSNRRRDSRPPPTAGPTLLTTGEDGAFRAANLDGDSFRVRIEADGYAPFTGEEIPAGASLKIRLQRGYTLEGRVLDLQTGTPLPGATVRACDRDVAGFGRAACRSATSGEGGRFAIVDLPRGVSLVEAVAPGRARARKPRVGIPAPSRSDGHEGETVELFLEPGARLAGRVVSLDGEPLEGARVAIRPRDQRLAGLLRREGEDSETTDEAGGFVFEGVPAGASYQLSVTKPGFAPARKGPFEVEAGVDRTDLRIGLGRGAVLAVRLLDGDEQPVSGLEIELSSAERRLPRGRGTERQVPEDRIESDDEGRFEASNLEPGVFRVRLLPEEFAEVEREDVTLREGKTTDLGTIVVREGRSITGTVTDSSLQPLTDARVRAVWREERGFNSRTVRTDSEGRYRVPGLGDSPVRRLSASAPGYADEQSENVAPGEKAVDFALERTGSVVGRVLLTTGEPPPAFQVRAHLEAGQEPARTFRTMGFRDRGVREQVYTDPVGNFRLDDLKPDTYTIEAIATGKAPARKTGVKILGDDATDIGTLTLEDGITLRGRVLATRDETPVPGATVHAFPPKSAGILQNDSGAGTITVSGSDGRFAIEGLTPGAHNVAVEHPDFSRADARVTLQAGVDPPELVVRLSAGGTLTGTVRDAGRQPLPDAQILVHRVDGSSDPRMLATDVEGRYTAERLAPGNYQAAYVPEGSDVRRMGMKSATIREGETTILDFDESAAITLTGRVLRGEEPLGEALLFFSLESGTSGMEMKAAQADAGGGYEVGLDRAGAYKVYVQTGGLRGFRGSGSVELAVPDEPEVVLDVVLQSAGITGTVTDTEGRPVAGAVVQARLEGSDAAGFTVGTTARTDGAGAFAIESVEPGAYRVSVAATGYSTAERYPVEIPDAGTMTTVDFRLEPGRSLRGRVVDPQGSGVAGALVYVSPSGAASTTRATPGQTDINGVFVATAPAHGVVDLSVVAGGWAPAWRTGVTLGDGEGEDVVIRLSTGGSLQVRVSGNDGRPLSGKQVVVKSLTTYPGMSMATALRRPRATDLDGMTSVDLLSPGSYEVGIAGREDVQPVTVAVDDGEQAVVALTAP